MHGTAPDRPAPTEYAPPYQGYVDAIPEGDVLDYLSAQLGEFDVLFGHLSDEAAEARYAPGKWSIKEVLGHITDAERIFSYRLLRIARGDTTPLAGFDENEYVRVANFDGYPLLDLRRYFCDVRTSTLALMRGLDSDAWARKGTASGFEISARALAYVTAGHAAHHLQILHERYGLSGTPAPLPPL